MAGDKFILAIDQGTTGTTGIIFDGEGRVVSRAYREVTQQYPQPGWVEHDPQELLDSSLAVAREAQDQAGIGLDRLAGLGITNQRETTVVWERDSGRPVSNAIVWQCRRTAPLCEELKERGFGPLVTDRTGLVIDAYFSATKLRWLLDNTPDGQERASNGELLFGTVDSWLVWNLTGGAVHATDYTNAARTMLFNIHDLCWDRDVLAALEIPEAMLPAVFPSAHVFGEVAVGMLGDRPVLLAGVAGDQQAALFGQACFDSGMTKNTYGTGSFVLMNTGRAAVRSEHGLVTTLAAGTGDRPVYALEGSIFVTGAAVQWLRDGLGIITEAAESEALARSVTDNGGVYFVPAFVGLGAPHWDMYARGTIVGLTRGSGRGHIARATLEAIAYQTRDVVEIMTVESKLALSLLRVDGGGTANDFLMQFQADILGVPIQVAEIADTTALGAAQLAGLTVGVWRDLPQLAGSWQPSRSFEPAMSADQRDSLYDGWRRALERAGDWADRADSDR